MRVKNPRISFSKTSDLTPIASNLFKCPQKKSAFECVNKTSEFKNKLLLEFTNSLERKSEQNAYNVDYRSETNRNFSNPSICPLMKSKIKLVQTKDPPFNILKLGQLIPKQRQLKRSRGGKSCVIVSSAGSLTGSNLGNFIGKKINSIQSNISTYFLFPIHIFHSKTFFELQKIITISSWDSITLPPKDMRSMLVTRRR